MYLLHSLSLVYWYSSLSSMPGIQAMWSVPYIALDTHSVCEGKKLLADNLVECHLTTVSDTICHSATSEINNVTCRTNSKPTTQFYTNNKWLDAYSAWNYPQKYDFGMSRKVGIKLLQQFENGGIELSNVIFTVVLADKDGACWLKHAWVIITVRYP